tara:strand:- start:19 stop:1089 length:1071 start_codon:yes stop_codon:yes gene_type:complete
MTEELFLLSQPMELPIATIVGGTITLESLKQEHATLLENIKIQRETYGEFCEDEQELNDTLGPIEEKPEPYSNGTIKTRPILKKYAMSLCEKLDLDLRIEIAEEALRDVDLSPQQVKADMKHYVAICEKKIASQKELCEQLQEQVKQLMDTIALVASPNKGISPLAMAMHKNLTSVESLLLNSSVHCMAENDILFATSTSSMETLLRWGANIDWSIGSCLWLAGRNTDGEVNMYDGVRNGIPQSIVLDKNNKHFIPLKVCDITLLNFGPYTTTEILSVGHIFLNRTNQSTYNGPSTPYQVTPLKIASLRSSLEMVKFLHEKGATIGDTQYHVPNGTEGDLVAGYLQTHGSKPVIRF